MNKTIRALIIEDNPAAVDLIREMLPERGSVSFQIESAERLSEALLRLKNGGIDVALLDIGLPDSQGMYTYLKLRSEQPEMPVIIMTSRDDQELAIEMMKEGAQDYLIKGLIGGDLLVRSIQHAIERKRMGEALRKSEQRFRSFIENASDIVYEMSTEGIFTYLSPNWLDMMGEPAQYAIGRSFKCYVHADDVLLFQEYFENVIKTGGRLVSSDYQVLRPDGLIRWHSSKGSAIRDKDGIVTGYMGIARDITLRKQAEETMRYISFHDTATGLYNRTYFEEELARVNNERELPVTVMFGDVNNLKLTNDIFGHTEGDNLLKRMASILRTNCRRNDIIARWGGDEFTVILPKTELSTAGELSRKIVEECEKVRDMAIQPSISLGIAAKEYKNDNIYQVLRESETRMYANKSAKIEKNQDLTIESLLREVDRRGHETHTRIQRLQKLAAENVKTFGLTEKQGQDLDLLIKIYSIGLVIAPEETLKALRPLSPKEWPVIKRAPEVAYRIAHSFSGLSHVAEIILACRERWDGKGYPKGLKGEDIPFLSRVFAIIDAYDAMTHERPFARTFTLEEARKELQNNAGKQFDPQIIELFFKKLSYLRVH